MSENRRKSAALLKKLEPELVEQTIALVYAQNPDMEARYGPQGKEKCRQDTHYHFSYLIEAVGSGSSALFNDYVIWAQQVLETRHLPAKDLHAHLVALKDVITQNLPIEHYVLVANHLNSALQVLEDKHGLPTETESALNEVAEKYLDFLLKGKRNQAIELIMQEVERGVPVKDIYLGVFQPVQHQIGRLWQKNKISVAQEHFCTAATQWAMSQLYPQVFGTERNGLKLVSTCATGDLHELGVRMVSDFFEMEGWDTYYLGSNVPVPSLLSALRDQKPDLLLLSATMTYHVPAVEAAIQAVRAAQDLKDLKIMVGGYPFNTAEELWQQVGADGYSKDAQEALVLAKELLEK
ncbi:hypothetical protein TH61_13455 [Rufibacter sp. DG15C]|uniref:cobalamin B12-binding domain-containing protein n=1 Tax=Rufibacter sp. DG15C TaxID=1379909 RepID=UPI00078B6EA4|nr:cobalamin-dependent protein [Rufibacter sp. DG15C]AMM51985.1 hypothetical protein TH61_13455 [Rufibacter sp. DG15C]